MSQKPPHSRPGRLAVVDGRTASAKYMAKVRTALLDHVGGEPTPMQAIIIEQCAILSLRLHLLDMKFIREPEGSLATTSDYLDWLGMLDRLRKRLTEPPPPSSRPSPELFDAELAEATRAAVPRPPDDDAHTVRSQARRQAYGTT